MPQVQNTKPKIAIIEFPGSNCETESIHAINQAGMEAVEFLWNQPATELDSFDGYFIIGGFSYEDRSRSGVISSKSPLMQELIKQASKGKPIIGVCNGAQILIESGLVPGLQNQQIAGALAVNIRQQNVHTIGTGFYNTWCNHKVTSVKNIFMKNFEAGEVFEMPIAHGEGRFVFPENVLEAMESNNQILLKYCDKKGNIIDDFPTNPNGTIQNIAAVGNLSGNVIAMMPHPERSAISPKFFEAIREYIIDNKTKFEYKTLGTKISKPKIEQYISTDQQLIIKSVITDKEAGTINQTLKELGIVATVSQMTHWSMDDQADIKAIIDCEELFNPNKENIITKLDGAGKSTSKFYLVTYIQDIVGEYKKEILTNQGIKINSLTKSVLWKIDGDDKAVLDSNILANPFSQRLVKY